MFWCYHYHSHNFVHHITWHRISQFSEWGSVYQCISNIQQVLHCIVELGCRNLPNFSILYFKPFQEYVFSNSLNLVQAKNADNRTGQTAMSSSSSSFGARTNFTCDWNLFCPTQILTIMFDDLVIYNELHHYLQSWVDDIKYLGYNTYICI